MELLGVERAEKGWNLLIKFQEKDRHRQNIIVNHFFPDIPMLRETRKRDSAGNPVYEQINCNYPEMSVKNYGEITVSGFIRHIPQYDQIVYKNSRKWAKFTGQESTLIRPTQGQLEELRLDSMHMGFKTVLEKKYPMTYVFVDGMWYPQLVWNRFNAIRKAEKELVEEKKFITEFQGAETRDEQLQVLRKHTVSFKEAEAPKEEKLPDLDKIQNEYVVVEIPAQGSISNYDGMTPYSPGSQFRVPEGADWRIYEVLNALNPAR